MLFRRIRRSSSRNWLAVSDVIGPLLRSVAFAVDFVGGFDMGGTYKPALVSPTRLPLLLPSDGPPPPPYGAPAHS